MLANHDDGNPLIFHTDCDVIANNFIMRAEDDAKIAEIDRLMRSRPKDMLEHEPPIDYLLRARDFSVLRDDKEVIVASSEVARALLLNDAPPAGFELLREVVHDDEAKSVYARLYRLKRPGG